MRILKRNLAFVLVMAMAIGMMVTANAANVEDYRDANDIGAKFTEAVDVMTALKILEGEDGTFHPERVLKRSEGAKIITYLMLGADGAESLNTSVAPFADVAANNWAAPYIAYCVSQGIVGGYGNGTFGPDDTLTGTQFAKMLLVALGYGVNGEFTGANWEIETNKQALTAGIYEGNLGVNFGAGVKREEAALYAFNTLANVMTVNYSDAFGAYYSGEIFNSASSFARKYTLGYKLYKLTKEYTAPDEFGRECHVWKKDDAKILTDKYHDEADAVYTSAVKSSKIYADLGLTNSYIDANVIVDGEYVDYDFRLAKNGTDGDRKTNQMGEKDKDDKYTNPDNIGNGVIVEAYLGDEAVLDKDGNVIGYREAVDLVVIHTYLAQVTDVDADKDKVTVEVVDNLTIDPELTDFTFETAVEYEEEDYVLITAAKDGKDVTIQSMKPVGTVEGDLNSTSADFVRFGGEQRNKATVNAITKTNKDMDGEDLKTSNDYTLLVDDYGYALGLVLVEENEDTAGYVYVNSIQGRSNNLLNSNAAVAEVRYLDGKGTEVLPLATDKRTVDGEKENCFRVNGYKGPSKDGKTPGEELLTGIAAVEDNWFLVEDIASDDAIPVGRFFSYSINSNDQLVLKAIPETDTEAKQYSDITVAFDAKTTGALVVGKVDSAENGETDDITLRFNAGSVAHVMDNDDNVKSYTGYKNINVKEKTLTDGSKTTSDVLVIATTKGGNLVKEVYVLSEAKVGGSNDVFVYFRAKDAVEDLGDGKHQVKLYTDSTTAQSYVVEDSDYTTLTTNGTGFYAITLNADDEISDLETIATYANGDEYTWVGTAAEVISADRNGFTLTGNDGRIYADKYVVFDDTDSSGLKVGSSSLIKAQTKNNDDVITRNGCEVVFVENDEHEVVLVLVTKAAVKVD